MDYATVEEMTDSYKTIRSRLRGKGRTVVVIDDVQDKPETKAQPEGKFELIPCSKEQIKHTLDGNFEEILSYEMNRVLKGVKCDLGDLIGSPSGEKKIMRRKIIALSAARGVTIDYLAEFFETSRASIVKNLKPETFIDLKLPPDYGISPVNNNALKELDKLIFEIAAKHNFTMLYLRKDVAGKFGKLGVIEARNELFYRAYMKLNFTFPQIGNFLGFDYTSVRYGALKHAEANGLDLSSVKKLKAKNND